MIKKTLLGILVIILLLAGCGQLPAETPTPHLTETPPTAETPTTAPMPSPTPSATPTSTSTPAPANEPPATGDWVVTDQQNIEDRTITLNGDLIVKNGGSLTLSNVKLLINCSYDGEYGISVEPGSSMYIYSSTVTAPNPQPRWHIAEHPDFPCVFIYVPTGITEKDSPRFNFLVDRAKAFEMRNSELYGCGWGEPYGDRMNPDVGLFLDNVESAHIEGNTFCSNNNSLTIKNMSDFSISDNTFSGDDAVSICLHYVSGLNISNNIFSSNLNPIFAFQAKKNTIENNRFSEFYEAIWLFYGCEENIISDNFISTRSGEAWAGIALGASPQEANNNLIKNNTISGCKHGLAIYHSSNNRIEGNVVSQVYCGMHLGYASKNVIVDNTFSKIGGSVPYLEQNGIELFHSDENIIANNCVSDVGAYGIILFGSSNDNIVQANLAWSCLRGIGLYHSSDNNQIVNNYIMLNNEQGIVVSACSANTIVDNNFIRNNEPSYDDGENHWHRAETGNFWSEYNEEDENDDGIGDIPMHINPNGIDYYPRISPLVLKSISVPEQQTVPTPENLPQGSPIIGNIVWENRTIDLDSSKIEIIGGGSLTLRNVTLILPIGFDGIYVRPGGSLFIYDSKITPVDGGGGFLFQVHKDADFIMKNSELHGCGLAPHSADWGGLQILTTSATIENNFISGSCYGITIENLGIPTLDGTSIFIKNNTITDCFQGIRGLGGYESLEGHVENNTILNCIQ